MMTKCCYRKPAKGRGLGSLGLCTTLLAAPPAPPPEGWGGWAPDRRVVGSSRAIHWLIRDSRSTVVRTDSDRMDMRWLLVCWAASLQWQRSPWTVMLSWQNSYISNMTYKQTDLVFGLWSEFIRRFVHARLQVSTCSGYDLWHTA